MVIVNRERVLRNWKGLGLKKVQSKGDIFAGSSVSSYVLIQYDFIDTYNDLDFSQGKCL